MTKTITHSVLWFGSWYNSDDKACGICGWFIYLHIYNRQSWRRNKSRNAKGHILTQCLLAFLSGGRLFHCRIKGCSFQTLKRSNIYNHVISKWVCYVLPSFKINTCHKSYCKCLLLTKSLKFWILPPINHWIVSYQQVVISCIQRSDHIFFLR